MTAQWGRRRLLGAVVVWAAAAGGRAAANGKGAMMDGFDEAQLKLEVSVQPDEGFVAVDFRLTNGSSHPVVVFDRLFATDRTGGRTVDPDLCWRWVDSDGVYAMAKIIPSVPANMLVEAPEIPYARGLAAGGVLEGRMLAPLPLDQSLPYGQAAPVPSVSEVSGVQVLLGYGIVDPEFAFVEIATPEGPVLSVRPPWAMSRHRVLRAAPVAAKLPVRRE